MINLEFTHSFFLFLFLFLFFAIFSSSSSLNNIHKCSQEQSRALLVFKQDYPYFSYSIDDLGYYPQCQDWLGSGYYPIMNNWNTNSDCCNWNGVTCHHSTGDVIALDLSCGMLKGTIHSNSSLFYLPRLLTLNLAFNDFTGSQIPREIGMLSNTLTHLNISKCGFSSQVPLEISLLRKLVSLDFSDDGYDFKLKSHVFINLLQNSTVLEELSLASVDISPILPAYVNISSSLRLLNLRDTRLRGKLPHYIFNFQTLENLDLSSNSFTGHIPSEITLLPKLVSLDLTYNVGDLEIQPHIFMSFLQNSTSLKLLLFGNVRIGLVLPTYLNISSSLKSLDLAHTCLKGKLPDNIFNLQYLEELYLFGNNNLTGPLPKVNSSIPLKVLDLFSCGLVGSLPSSLFSLQSLNYLSLGDNRLSGQVDVLNQGSVLQTFQQLANLISLDLAYNNFRGNRELDTLLSSLTNLELLDLSYSGLSIMTNDAKHYVNRDFYALALASCKIKVFPESLRAMKKIVYLDLSNNEIHGSIPHWIAEIGDNLIELNLSHNSISHFPRLQWGGLQSLYLQSNKIQGSFPISICDMNNLVVLDMSNNSFGGVIPKCFGNITSSLRTINLKNNHFQGTILDAYHDCGSLEGFILNGNQLEGEVPSFMSKCQYLEVVDLGNNHLNGTFPYWLGDLPNLQVLVLKSNNFHGPILTPSFDKLSFQSLQVFDLSNNSFVGQLPKMYFQNFKAMKNVVKQSAKPEYLFVAGMYYSITITVKGVMQDFPQIFVHYTIIDVSGNEVQGEIPSTIGGLNSLKVLNLSHNNLNGRIPHSLGSLSEIESLDLSSNQLIGEIPRDLANIEGLVVLNVCQNHLIGRIPEGTQFTTFDVSSFGGNSGLCGFPLPKCEHLDSQHQKVDGYHDEYDDESGSTWKLVLLGYGCGTLIGFVLGYLMLSVGKPKWFNEIFDSIEHMILERRKKRRRVYIAKRN